MILTRVLLFPQQRFDLEEYNALLEAGRADWKFFTNRFLSPNQYILQGFEVSGLGAPSPVTVNTSEATLINADTTGCNAWFTSEPGATPISVTLQPGQRNYLEIELEQDENVPLTRAFWDPTANGGEGAEFEQTVNTVSDLRAKIVVNQVAFTGLDSRIPLAIVDTNGSNTVVAILDRRPLYFRLGEALDAEKNFNWVDQTEPGVELVLSGIAGAYLPGEEITFTSGATATVKSGTGSPLQAIVFSSDSFSVGDTVTGSSSGATGTLVTASESFSGADKNITNFKEALDSVFTEIKRIKGSQFWFEDESISLSGGFRFLNSVITPDATSSGSSISWDGSELSFSDDNMSPDNLDVIAHIRILGYAQNIDLTRQDGTGGSSTISIPDGHVLYIEVPTLGNAVFSAQGVNPLNFKTVARAGFTVNDNNYWLAVREGTRLKFRGVGELEAGESQEIGDQTSTELLTALGLNETNPNPNYTSNIRGVLGESFLNRISTLTLNQGDSQEDRSAYLKSNEPVIWTGTELQFQEDIDLVILNTKTGTKTVHTIEASESPLVIGDGEAIYIDIDRTQASEVVSPVNTGVTPLPAQTQATKDIFVLFEREDLGVGNVLYLPFNKQFLRQGQSTFLGAAGGAQGVGTADLHDPLSTSLPSGASPTIDGETVVDGTQVLFSNLNTDNNRVYEASNAAVAVNWTPIFAFAGGLDPNPSELIVIKQGEAFATQLGKFTGTDWEFNKTVRYFDGGNYVEFESIKSVALVANTTDSIFEVEATNSENWNIFFSIIRGGSKISGILGLTHDGTDAEISMTGPFINGDIGITFEADIVGSDLRLRYSADNSGPDGEIKFFYYRWSDSIGGPGGVPSYSGASSSTTLAAGNLNEIQYHGVGGFLDADTQFQWNNGTKELNLNGYRIKALIAPFTLVNDEATPQVIEIFSVSTERYVKIEYRVERNAKFRFGTVTIMYDGTTVQFDDDFVGDAGIVTFDAVHSGGNVSWRYSTDDQSANGELKYSTRKLN